MTTHHYSLERYSGKRSRHHCPNCGDRNSFVRYVDEAGNYLADTVGRCNHESSCGYHYTPSAFFRDHPELKEKDWREVDWKEYHARNLPQSHGRPDRPSKPLCLIPIDLMHRSIKPQYPSDFTTFLRTLFHEQQITTLILQYNLGVTKARDVIYFQVDINGNCRTGKIMKYNPATGKRVKDPDAKFKINWVHSILKKTGTLDESWQLTQCLFGEHLLPQHPDKPIALVESEKTAIICSGLMPQYLWLATGGKSQLSQEKLSVLAGRKTIAFPDIDGYEEWKKKLSAAEIDIAVSDILQRYATEEQRKAHIDIADLLIQWKQNGELIPGTPRKVQLNDSNDIEILLEKWFSSEYLPEIHNLINDFDITPVTEEWLI